MSLRNVAVDGRRFHVWDEGQGPPLLLAHGFPLDHTMWQYQLGPLSDSCRVIAPDLRGFGASAAAEETMTMEEYAQDLDRLLDVLQVRQPITFCGLSMGGYIAWAFARLYPQRCQRFVLCDTRARADAADVARGRLVSAANVLREGSQELVESLLPRLFCPATRDNMPELVDQMRAVMLAADPRGVAAALRGMAQRADVTGWLTELQVPCLVVCGQYDVISPPQEMQEIAQALPEATYVEIPQAGHMSPLENPAFFNEALGKFLASAVR